MSYTETLANYCLNLKYEDLPEEVIEHAKKLTIHTINAALASYVTKQGKEAVALAKEFGGVKDEATIIGDGSKVSCVQAAFANGSLADIVEWEDCTWTGHAAAGAIPVALAVGEKVKASGKDFLSAIVAAYEGYQRIASAVQPSKERWNKHGWGLTTWQVFAGLFPAARFLKLSQEQMNQAIGVAATLCHIVCRKTYHSYSTVYHYHHGTTCRDAIVAASIAKSGISNLYDVLDGDDGYWLSITDQCKWEWFTKDLGKEYFILETLMKHWPTNLWIQAPLDALDAIVKENKIKPGDVAEMIISPGFDRRMSYRREGLRGNLEAQFSIPFSLATFLFEPKPSPYWYEDDRLARPEILELAGKVRAEGPTIQIYDALQKFWAGSFPEVTITVVTNDGRKLSKTVQFPKGHARNKMSREELTERFEMGASYVLNQDRIKKASEMIWKLEEVDDVSKLADLLHK